MQKNLGRGDFLENGPIAQPAAAVSRAWRRSALCRRSRPWRRSVKYAVARLTANSRTREGNASRKRSETPSCKAASTPGWMTGKVDSSRGWRTTRDSQPSLVRTQSLPEGRPQHVDTVTPAGEGRVFAGATGNGKDQIAMPGEPAAGFKYLDDNRRQRHDCRAAAFHSGCRYPQSSALPAIGGEAVAYLAPLQLGPLLTAQRHQQQAPKKIGQHGARQMAAITDC